MEPGVDQKMNNSLEACVLISIVQPLTSSSRRTATTTYPTSPPTTITDVSSNTRQTIYMKMNATTLEPIWVKTITGSGGGSGVVPAFYVENLAADSSGNVLLAGSVNSGKLGCRQGCNFNEQGRVEKCIIFALR